jgi:hypothetical protein
MSYVFFQGARINEDIVKVNNATNIEEFMEAIVSVGLERRRRVWETKWESARFPWGHMTFYMRFAGGVPLRIKRELDVQFLAE